MNHRRPLILGLALLASLVCKPAANIEQRAGQQPAATREVTAPFQSSCPGYRATNVTVSADSIGPIPLDSPLSVAVRLCPRFQRGDNYLESGNRVLVWTFDINGVQVSAAQLQFGTATDTSRPVEEWIVGGHVEHPVLL